MPQPAGGATAITPKNGASGSSRPHGSRPVFFSLSSGICIRVGVSKSSGSAPASGRIML
jgi:hypothetical protein